MAAPVISAPASETRKAAMRATCSVCTHLDGSASGLALRLASVFMALMSEDGWRRVPFRHSGCGLSVTVHVVRQVQDPALFSPRCSGANLNFGEAAHDYRRS